MCRGRLFVDRSKMVVEQNFKCELAFFSRFANNLAGAENGIRARAAGSFCRDALDPFGYQHSWSIGFHETSPLSIV